MALATRFKWFQGMHLHNYIKYLATRKPLPPGLELSPSQHMVIEKEWRDWEWDYIPKGGIVGKTVLDAGAGKGESAFFLIEHGAAKVICIEPDSDNVKGLKANAARLGWNIEVIQSKLLLEHLKLPFDFAKVDCEFGEKILLALNKLPPLTVEIHSKQLADRFRQRFPEMRIEKRYRWPFNTWMGFTD